MAYAPEEAAEMAGISQALVLNIGTLSVEEIEAMLLAGVAAGAKGIPIVLDPVGAGATTFRTESALRLLRELPITVLRGNRGEIGALVGSGEVRGVEATGSEDPLQVATAARDAFGVTVAVTGPTDVIVGPDRTYLVRNGSPLLAMITGSGCMATAAIGIFASAGDDPALQTALGLATYGRLPSGRRKTIPARGRSGRGCWMRWRRWVRKERAGSTSASRKRRTASWSMVSPQAFCGASPVANLRARRWRCDQARFGGETPPD